MSHPAVPLPEREDPPDREGTVIPGPWAPADPELTPELEPDPEPRPCALEDIPPPPIPLCAQCGAPIHVMRVGNLISGQSELVQVSCGEIEAIRARVSGRGRARRRWSR